MQVFDSTLMIDDHGRRSPINQSTAIESMQSEARSRDDVASKIVSTACGDK